MAANLVNEPLTYLRPCRPLAEDMSPSVRWRNPLDPEPACPSLESLKDNHRLRAPPWLIVWRVKERTGTPALCPSDEAHFGRCG